ncbi:protein mono-ADP-ribosyltransferase Parp16 [Drosophila tropicalis]|uniref:protein mono-ADP-ribosyltransferase Parp16 n=1 Tax=Drosophila tropicalis TaxID=46794 RepID=UPI0035ABB208
MNLTNLQMNDKDKDDKDDGTRGRRKMLQQVFKRLQSDLLACDAQWTLFVAAAHSYLYERLVLPFPKDFVTNTRKLKIELICETIAEVPRLEYVLEQLNLGLSKCFSTQAVKLLHTVLVKHRDRMALSTLRPCEFSELYEHLQMPAPKNSPTQIFEVMASGKDYAQLRASHSYPVRLGFYGGKLDELYTILIAGTVPNEHEPLMLTTDIDEALAMSPAAAGWGGSRCGSVLRSVAVVEFINMPPHVTVVKDNRHVLIKSSSCMQISYLLIYGQSCDAYERSMEQPYKRLLRWAEANQDVLLMSLCVLGLSIVSRTGGGYLRSFAETGFHFFKRNLLK